MNITDNLTRIKEGKDNIIKSLKNKGVDINDNTLINEIPTIIDNAEIGGGGGDTPSVPTELVQKYEGASVFRIEVPEDNYEFAINLCNDATKATYDVDWGDGVLESGLTTDEQHHTYSKKGTYDVNIYNISKDITLGGYFINSYEVGYTQYFRKIIYFLFNNSSNDFWSGTYIENKEYVICTNILIGKGIYTFGNYAFSACTLLQSVVLSNSIISIGNNAFDGCTSLQSIVIPEGVKSIGNYTFQSCSSLQSIVIPESVTSIGYNAFSSCTSLQSIVIPEGVKSIGNQVFSQCTSLTSVTIPNSVTSIESYAFSTCASLQNIVIPESVKTLKYESFNKCTSLQSIVIPNSVTTIDGGCFNNCFSLQEIICNGLTPPNIQNNSFPTSNLKYSKKYLYVPKDSVGYNEGNWKTYLIDKGWELRYIEDKPEKVPTTLKLKTKNNFFHNLQAIGQANLIDYELINDEYIYNFDDKITELHQYTFYNKVLEEIELPESVEIIGNLTFANSNNLRSIICKAMIAPTIQSNTFSSVGSKVPSGTPKILRVPEGAEGYDVWLSQLSGFTLEYIPLSEL